MKPICTLCVTIHNKINFFRNLYLAIDNIITIKKSKQILNDVSMAFYKKNCTFLTVVRHLFTNIEF